MHGSPSPPQHFYCSQICSGSHAITLTNPHYFCITKSKFHIFQVYGHDVNLWCHKQDNLTQIHTKCSLIFFDSWYKCLLFMQTDQTWRLHFPHLCPGHSREMCKQGINPCSIYLTLTVAWQSGSIHNKPAQQALHCLEFLGIMQKQSQIQSPVQLLVTAGQTHSCQSWGNAE